RHRNHFSKTCKNHRRYKIQHYYFVRCLEYLFFFQAEDGIRAFHVTGVQTCALPIWVVERSGGPTGRHRARSARPRLRPTPRKSRSEERRVGKESRQTSTTKDEEKMT